MLIAVSRRTSSANAIYAVRDFRRAIEDLEDYTPRVIIFSLDYFEFVPAFEAVYKNQSRKTSAGGVLPSK
jgi:hypothetical protein